MEDLRGPQYDAGIELGLQASSRILDSDSLENESENGKRSEVGDTISIILCCYRLTSFKPVDPRALVGTLRSWHNNLSKFAPGKKQVEDAFTSLSQNVTERVNVKSRKNNLPDDLLQAMGNLQAATAEFLRQFWSALYDDKDFAKDHVEKMASYLGSTYGKIAPMMTAARNQGHDPQVVRDVSLA
ncbi:hypothetical protein AG1IA_03455 [Rhizoctonia solani AG-1 IA]|uniref:Uncharacterized protein n=1 Tax=Thanatephorus cucumeris (strain AG1-IA) TaxID=983506 RepID=L8WWN9_THACA|nr:hypothetical protein AG1IA_03455 [Rhizoctonia solani AG-1 IA]